MADTGTRKVLWHSVAPWAPTGYGTQTGLFAPRINALDNVDLAISSGWGLTGSHIKFGGIEVYPGNDWNRNALTWALHHGQGQPVTVITLMDVWPLERDLFSAIEKQGRLACWVPIDHKPVPPVLVAEFLKETNAIPIAMSRFGEEELRTAGFDPLYVPHGVDTETYLPRDRKETRKMLSLPEDEFIVGMVANNQGQSPPRKAFSESFMAFSIFRETHPDSTLYLHAEVTGYKGGLDLIAMLNRFEIPPESVKITPQDLMEYGFPAGAMAAVYNSFDVLLNPSYGEGFGVPIVEAQACGTPVIVTDWTSMPELCGAGWKVSGTLWDHAMQEAFWLKPDVDQIVGALEDAYTVRNNLELRKQAREFALQYDADRVMEEYWVPVLDRIHQPREVQPLRPNRAQRRGKKVTA